MGISVAPQRDLVSLLFCFCRSPLKGFLIPFQIMRGTSKPGHIYFVDIDTYNAGIPYADSFYATSHCCLSTCIPEDADFIGNAKECSRLTVIGNVKYKKTVWGLVKSERSFHGITFITRGECCASPVAQFQAILNNP